MIAAPLAATLIQLAISRSREYLADATGAELAGDPDSLARALERLHTGAARFPLATAQPATASMFIVNPLTSRGVSALFSTHPPFDERVRRLREMRLHG
jgi:heat shock protein HtpX